ncbi:alpha/beta fold hydrolase [Fusibacter paucivorans]|uniref:Alpha/beta fold hydrolase n=1 Tax=Fusibacter paucivorans TaxID=76009 RepID=A0ABS5PR35_9FIRM|nr:alpha/beta fold hydrolase [Fusibacter paucivorans]MBS7527623.1 alpha/beta fold hydrolase [Fusibacter paucivorans]
MILNILLLAVALVLGVGLYLSRQAMYPKTRSDDSVWQAELKRMPILETFYNNAAIESVLIQSHDTYMLSGWWLKSPAAKGVVIVVHGIRLNKFASVKYMRMFHDLGYHVLAYDQRNHGGSGGDFTSYGVLESEDLKCVVDWVQARTSNLLDIYTHGESMGAATVLMHAAKDSRIQGTIADCSFSEAERTFKERLMIDYHLPKWPLMFFADGFNRLKTGIGFQDMSPLKTLSDISAPVMIIHGTTDRYVPIAHAEQLYQTLESFGKVPVTFFPVEGAGHAKSISTNYEAYLVGCESFLTDCARIQATDAAVTA